MSLQHTYQRFLAAPTASALTEAASLNYITTTTSVKSSEEIVKYLTRESKHLKKRVQKIISSVETGDMLVLEIETEIEFLTSGANFLPGLDDNFLADHVVTFPIVHFVNFQDARITQARLFWDQSTLLKQLGVIGRNGRNWPIKEGQEQCKLIAQAVKAHGSGTSDSSKNIPNGNANRNGNGNRTCSSTARTDDSEFSTNSKRPASNSRTSNAMGDPHASLRLFGGSEEEEEKPCPIAPRANSEYRPPSRDLTAIIGEPDEDEQATKPVLPPKARSSFSKGQTFSLGDDSDDQPTPKALEKIMHVHPKKYAHFEFGDGEDAPKAAPVPAKAVNNQKGSSWDFEDFVTPEKRPIRPRKDDVRHFGWSEDEDEALAPSPIKQPKKMVPRRDAETHFAIRDDPETPKPLSNNMVNQMHRRNNDSHFEISDESPVSNSQIKKEIPTNRIAVVNQMKASWNAGEDDIDSFYAGMGGEVKTAGIRIAGNGQGNRKTTDSHWEHGDNSPSGPIPGKTARRAGVKTETESSGFWDY